MRSTKELWYILRHPVSGFEDIKYKKSGSVCLSTLISLLWFVASIVQNQYTSAWFNSNNTNQTNIFFIFIATTVMFLFFTVSNWSICTLFNGEGTFRQIYIVTGYALVPYIISIFVNTFCSHLFCIQENMFLQFISIVGTLYSLFLLSVGMMQIHQYRFVQMIIAVIISVVGIFLILLLCFLMIMLIREIFAFFQSIFDEILMRSMV